MRSLLVVAALAIPQVAAAGDLAWLTSAFRHADENGIRAVLADTVKVEIPIDTPVCAKLSGAVTRDKLAPCLRGLAYLGQLYVRPGIGAADATLIGIRALALEVKVAGKKIVAIGPVAADRNDLGWPTTFGDIDIDFAPSKTLAAQLDKRGDTLQAVHKVCVDEHGAITSRRLVEKSGSGPFDKESTAWVAALSKRLPFKPYGTAIAYCDLVQVAYPSSVEGGVEGGVVGGVEGGVVGDVPPPPPPPAPPRNIPPTLLEPLRIAGERAIVPDDATKTEITRKQKSKVVASFKLCVSDTGEVVQVTMLKSSGFPAYDQKLERGMRTWAYHPYVVNDRPTPICTAVTFIYSQEPPPPPPP